MADIDYFSYELWINSKTENFPYYNPATLPDDKDNPLFPLIAGGLKYDNGTLTLPKDGLESARECGFTVGSQFSLGASFFKESLANAKSAGIRVMFINNGFIQYSIDHMLVNNDANGNKDWFSGLYLSDEPSLADLNGTTSEGMKLRNEYFKLMDQNEEVIVVINLIGGPDDNGGFPDEASFKSYVETFQKNFKPAVFSYDFYPIEEKSNLLYEGTAITTRAPQEGEIEVQYNKFYNALKVFSEISHHTEVNRPFWNYCQSKSYMILNRYHFAPIALEQYIRFQIFSSLAYGAKGIAYWTYCMSPNSTNEQGETKEAYLSALLDRKGNKTASWYFAQRVNNEVHKYKEIFLNANYEGTIPSSKIYRYPASNPNFKLTIEAEGDERILISEFTTDFDTYLVIMSMDALNYQKINIKVSTYSQQWALVTELTPARSNSEENTILINGDNERIMIPGGYRILKFLTHIPEPI